MDRLTVAQIDGLTGWARAKYLAMARGFYVDITPSQVDFVLRRGTGSYTYARRESERDAWEAAFAEFTSDEQLAFHLIQEGHRFGALTITPIGLTLAKARFGNFRESALDTYPVAICRAFLYAAHGITSEPGQGGQNG